MPAPRNSLALLLAAALAGGPAGAASKRPAAIDDTPRDQLQRVEHDIVGTQAKRKALDAEADRLAAEMAELDKRLVAAARAVQEGESTLAGLEARHADIESEEKAAAAELERRRGEMATTLAALERLGRRPPEALLAEPGAPVDGLRSAMLLGAIVPQIEARAAALKRSLTALASLRSELAESRQAVTAGGERLSTEQRALNRLLAEKKERQAAVQTAAEEAGKRVAALGEKANDLKALIQKLDDEAKRRAEQEAARRKAEEARAAAESEARAAAEAAEAKAEARRLAEIRQAPPIGKAKGQLPLPVVGVLAARYDTPLPFGNRLRGITVRARSQATVISPIGGEVAFAGPFRGYGNLLIVAAGDGFHFLLAGMGRIDVSVGQHVLAGEPVGELGPEGFQRDGAPAGGAPELYVELRRRGEPIDPLPWFSRRDDSTRSGKASG